MNAPSMSCPFQGISRVTCLLGLLIATGALDALGQTAAPGARPQVGVALGGGPLLLGSWIESGSAFDEWDAADFDTNVSGGVIAETLIGAVFAGVSTGFDGSWRFYLGVGRIFR